MFARIYRVDEVADHFAILDEYIRERFVDRLLASGRQHEVLGEVVAARAVVVNGRRLLSFSAVLEASRPTPEAWHDITHYAASSVVHGDLKVDNVLVDSDGRHPPHHRSVR